MADIFLSYARADKARVAPLVAALEAQGWSVWWDPAISPGQEFDDLIAEEIDRASAVVVVWTPASVSSRWVRGEAREAADRGILVPVRFEKARLPIDVRAVHTTDIDDWKEDPASAPFQEVRGALSRLLKNVKPKHQAGGQESRETSICVLPFVNMSGDPEQEYFSDGLSEELLNQLAQMKGLKVAARTSSFAFKGQNPDLKAVSEKLGVAHVLEGSVRKQGNRLRITAQLIKCADGYHLWSNTFNRELDDVFQIQEDIARAVADALKITLGMNQSTLVPGGTANVDAYDLYLRGRAQLHHVSAQGAQRAIALLRQAIELDPRFYLAWSLLAESYLHATVWDYETAEISRQLYDEACERTKTFAPEPWMKHDAAAAQHVMKREWLAAETAYEESRRLMPSELPAQNPSNMYMPGSAGLLITVGRAAEAVEIFRRMARNDPLAPLPTLPLMLDCLGRYDEAQAEFKRQLSLPTDPMVPEFYAFLRSLAREGSQTAKSHLKHLIAFVSEASRSLYGEVLAKFDNKSEVLLLLHQSFQSPSVQIPLAMSAISWLAAYFGDDALALECLRAVLVKMHSPLLGYIWHPLFASVRKMEGFKQLVRDLGIYEYWRKSGHWGDFARPFGADGFEIVR